MKKILAYLILFSSVAVAQDSASYIHGHYSVVRETNGRRAVGRDTLRVPAIIADGDAIGTADIGAADSVQVSIIGLVPSDVAFITYTGATFAATKAVHYAIYAASTLTIFGDAEKKVSYIVRRPP